MHTSSQQPAFVIETNFETSQKGMAMPSKSHVLIAVEPNAHWRLCMLRRQRRQGSGKCGLRFLPSKTTAHPGTLDGYFVCGQMQHMRHHGLNFRRMLSRRNNEHRPILARFRPGRLSLQIKMLLTAQFKCSSEGVRRLSQRFSNLTAPDVVWFIMKTARRNSLL